MTIVFWLFALASIGLWVQNWVWQITTLNFIYSPQLSVSLSKPVSKVVDLFRSSCRFTNPLLSVSNSHYVFKRFSNIISGFSITSHTFLVSVVHGVWLTASFWVWGFAGLNPKALVFSGPSWSGSHPVLSLRGKGFPLLLSPWKGRKDSLFLSLSRPPSFSLLSRDLQSGSRKLLLDHTCSRHKITHQ